MNWLTRVVRPKFQALVGKKDVPDNLWEKCGKCGQMLFHRELEANQRVCGHCGYHMRIGAKRRLEILFGDDDYTRIELPAVPLDPLKFRDAKRYTDRLKEAQARAGESEAIVVVHGRLGQHPVVVAVLDFAFMGGSMGVAVGEGFVAAAKLAKLQSAPLIVFTASGGARMQEGVLSLMQLPRTIIAVEELKAARLPYIVVMTDPTTGGVTASFAMLGDVHLAEPGALIGFAGARVIEQTVREKLPAGFQTAEFVLDHGMVDMVVARRELRSTLIRLISLLRQTEPAGEVVTLTDAVVRVHGEGERAQPPGADPTRGV
ncbi:MAG: acetyl-CoA carboxylase carboxyltransferase subunit beta [Alphaproteobacteria bacterium]|nr:acetyl-CoA carboxylase carboxyltransferase subunit beta [Alphaproteobacteria bacterium]